MTGTCYDQICLARNVVRQKNDYYYAQYATNVIWKLYKLLAYVNANNNNNNNSDDVGEKKNMIGVHFDEKKDEEVEKS